jgi:hypothetical protein
MKKGKTKKKLNKNKNEKCTIVKTTTTKMNSVQ